MKKELRNFWRLLKIKGKLNSTQICLLYSLPVLRVCNPEIDCEKIRKKLEGVLFSGEEMDDKDFEKPFPNLITRINNFSKKKGIKDRDEARIRYWREGHNSYVNKECWVYFVGEVEKIEEKGSRRVAVCSDLNAIIPSYHDDLKVGDKISIHGGSVAEILSEEDYEKYK